MIDDASPSGRRPRRRRPGRLLIPVCAVAIVTAALPRFSAPDETGADNPAPVEQAARPTDAAIEPARHAWMFDPTPLLGAGTRTLGEAAPMAAALVPPDAPVLQIAQAAPVATPRSASPAARLVQSVPVPVPMRRPSDLLATSEPPRLAQRSAVPRTRLAAAGDVEAERSFFDTVFGTKPKSEPAMAYAAIDPNSLGTGADPARPRGPLQSPMPGAGTAIYDISARLVTLPSGERLEAHSGLGASMDNPRGVHLRMRGATPPGTYDLTEREAMFHGVRALRLNPVGGPGAIHGRTGILAHTYMLGPSGASNGCVVFKNYNRFLQAYLRGEIRRLVVVPGRSDGFPAIADRLFGGR